MRLLAVSMLTLLSTTAAADPLGDDATMFGPGGALDFGRMPRHDLQPLGESVPFELDEDGELDPQAIVNGTVVGTYEYENVVALAAFDNWGGFIFCSGSLIDTEWVLTAAHCLEGLPNNYDLVILFGGDIINVGFTDSIDFAASYPHPQYDAQAFLNDIGLVQLAWPKNGVDLVVLNDEAVNAQWYGDELTILGYGITSDNAYDSGTKRVTEIPIVWHDSQYVYTEAPNTNVCQGDSGGPAFETTPEGNLEQVGVNAFVTPGCVGGSAGLTRVDKHIAWIQGYVPNVLLSGSGEGSGGEDPGTDGTSGGGGGGGGGGGAPGEVDDLDADAIDRDLGKAPTPTGYPVGVRCAVGSSGPATGWLVVLGILALRRRFVHGYNT